MLFDSLLKKRSPGKLKTAFVAIICLTGYKAISQIEIKGKIVDSLHNPLPYASVLVTTHNAVKIYLSTSANDSGLFDITLDSGNYYFSFSNAGYKIKQTVLKIDGSRSKIDFGEIILTGDENVLKTVTIQTKKPIYNFFPGRIEYDVQNDPRNTGKNAFEMLRQAPLVSITGTGNIALKGRTTFILQLNGKTVQALSANPENFLASFDQTQVEKIEIITNPSSKYSAEGITGIINIVTRKAKRPGSYGSVMFADDTYNSLLTSANIFGYKGKIGYSAMLSASQWRNGSYNYTLQQSVATQYTTIVSHTEPRRENANGLVSISYQVNPKNIINLDVNSFNGKGNIVQTFSSIHSTFSSLNLLRDNMISVNTDWETKIDSLSSLVISYKLEHQQSRSSVELEDPAAETKNQLVSLEHTAQADFKRKAIQVGSKIIMRSLGSEMIGQSNAGRLDYRQNIYAAYISSTKTVSNFNLEYGLRGEYTQYQGKKDHASVFLKSDYGQIFPSVSLDRSFSKSNINISLGYSRRIARPQLYYLNPYINNANPYSLNMGNSILKPEFSQNLELRMTKQDKKSNYHILTLSYQKGSNSILNFLIPVNDTTIASTYINFHRQHLAGLSFYSSFSIFKTVQVNLSNNLYWTFYPESDPPNASTVVSGNKGVIGSLGLSFSGSFLKRVRYSLSNSYNFPDVYLQGHGSSFFYQDFTFACPLLKNKFMAFVSVRQPFLSRYSYKSFYSDMNFIQTVANETPQRRVFAGVRYGFGKAGKANVRTRSKISNDDKKNKNNLDAIK